MVTTIVGVSGAIGSGKTSIARALGHQVAGSTVRSFGDVVRREAVARGRGIVREDLQLTGVELIAEGWDQFVSKALDPEPTADVLIVDGIRHVEAARRVHARWPNANLLLVYIKPSDAVMEKRLEVRGENSTNLAHEVESELPDVLATADLVLEDEDVQGNVASVLRAIRTL